MSAVRNTQGAEDADFGRPQDRLREAERIMREADDLDAEDRAFLSAVAGVLRQAAMDLWAHGPLCECGTGCDACDDNLWEPPARAALAVADAYLGTEARDVV